MREYADKNALIAEIKNTANLFIKEFDGISEADKKINTVAPFKSFRGKIRKWKKLHSA